MQSGIFAHNLDQVSINLERSVATQVSNQRREKIAELNREYLNHLI